MNGEIIILFSSKDSMLDKGKVNDILSECIINIRKSLDLNTFTTIGSYEKDSLSVHLSYENAVKLQSYCIVSKPNSIIDYSRIEKNLGYIKDDIKIDYDLLKSLLSKKDKNAAYKFIDDIFLQIENSDLITPSYIQNLYIEMTYNILNIARLLTGNAFNVLDRCGNLYADIAHMNTIDELSASLKSIICDICEYIISEDRNQSPLIRRVLYYIETNYSKDISLKYLSNAFNVNASYLGQLFKTETGEIFSDYLNKIRIEKAKELLLNSNLKTNEISQKVGYSSPNYFYKTFKKITGVHPTDFRRYTNIKV